MYEIDQKTIDMTLDEFKQYIVPDGWKLTHVMGDEKYIGECKWAFNMHVVIERKKV